MASGASLVIYIDKDKIHTNQDTCTYICVHVIDSLNTYIDLLRRT